MKQKQWVVKYNYNKANNNPDSWNVLNIVSTRKLHALQATPQINILYCEEYIGQYVSVV